MNQPNGPISHSGTGDLAVIGEDTANPTTVSLQVLQSIYHELTGKSESLSKSYNNPFQITASDLDQLNYRIFQYCEQYQVKETTASIKVYYVDDTQDTFTCYDRFTHFNSGSASAVESVLLTYNFLILLPKLNKPQTYKLSVRIASRIAISKRLREEMPFQIPAIFRTMGNRTAVVEVSYVDYVVARSMLTVVDSWFSSIPVARQSWTWTFLLKRTHYLPFILKYFVGMIVAYFIYATIPYVITESTPRELLVRSLFAGFVCLFVFYRAAHHLGRAAESSLDSWSELSFVSLTAGDKKEIESAQHSNKQNLINGILKLVVALLAPLLAKTIQLFVFPN